MMVNIRGLKSKEKSIKEIVKEEQPTILLLMETMCQDDYPDIKGYIKKTIRKRDDQWGGIMFAVKEEFERNIQIKSENVEKAEMLFIQMTCGKSKMTVGLVYAPQEDETTREEMDKMYEYIEKEIITAKAENQIVLIGGDFNCKIGDVIDGNKKEVTKAGRRLIKLAKNNEMLIVNATEKCEGKWTRVQKEKAGIRKSIIDYVLISKDHEAAIKKMEIDEERERTPFRDDSKLGRKTFTDHNMITIEMNLYPEKNIEETIRIDRNKMEQFREATNNSNLSEIWKENQEKQLKEIYTQWDQEVIRILKSTCGRKKKDRKEIETREVRMMRRKRATLKEDLQKENSTKVKSIIKKRREMIQQHIIYSRRKGSSRKALKVASKIMKGGAFNGSAYWDFKREIDKSKKVIKGTSINDNVLCMYREEVGGPERPAPETVKTRVGRVSRKPQKLNL